MIRLTGKKLPLRLPAACLVFLLCGASVFFAEGPGRDSATPQIHVSPSGSDETGDGTSERPFATVGRAAELIVPGTEVILHEGSYDGIVLGREASGTGEQPVILRAADGERPVIRIRQAAAKGVEDVGEETEEEIEEEYVGIRLVNVDNITIRGLEVEGGTHGILYESTREQGEKALENITICDCTVHGVRGTHGICVYARNDLAPVRNLRMTGCHVYDCECGSSEATVFNGNIDGFEITGNRIHDNNNIGIDMIGFEGTAAHPDGSSPGNPYEADFVRNGLCADNIIYGISAEGNGAYFEDGEYDLCADGIYVDGGQDIEICRNFIFCCNIGLEAATEHSPDDNELFSVSGIRVHDNVIADCSGWCGLCFGGYESSLGFTEDCEFRNNTIVGCEALVAVQRSRNNRVSANLLADGNMAVEYSEECMPEDMLGNSISGNAAALIADEDSWETEYGVLYVSQDEVLDGFHSLVPGCGSAFEPDEEAVRLYEEYDAG